jgi:hypothetical protein
VEKPKPSFQAFDPEAEIELRERNLPHWFQAGVAVFITFRTIDSLPREVILRNQRELEVWLNAKGLPITLAVWDQRQISRADQQELAALSSVDRKYFRKLKDRLFHYALDECHGQCILKQPDLAKVVADAILHKHGKAYDLDSFVIMPNHVHAIAQFHVGFDLTIVGQSWMRYTARLINKT